MALKMRLLSPAPGEGELEGWQRCGPAGDPGRSSGTLSPRHFSARHRSPRGSACPWLPVPTCSAWKASAVVSREQRPLPTPHCSVSQAQPETLRGVPCFLTLTLVTLLPLMVLLPAVPSEAWPFWPRLMPVTFLMQLAGCPCLPAAPRPLAALNVSSLLCAAARVVLLPPV